MLLLLADTLAVGLCLSFLFYAWRKRGRPNHLPPGPPGAPFVGNLLQMPSKDAARVFRDLSKEYGDLVTLRLPGLSLLVLNSRQAISDLFVGRSAIYSDRSQLVMARDLVGFEDTVFLTSNTPRFRSCRKLLRRGLGVGAMRSFAPLLDRQSAFLLENLRRSPDAFVDVARRNAAAVAMKVAYGYPGLDEDAEFYDTMLETSKYFSETITFGTFLVDVIPVLRYLPTWFPLAYFQRYAARAKPVVTECLNKPFEETKRHIEMGTAGASFSAMLLGEANGDAETEHCIKLCSSGILLGQMDTTTAAMSWFFLAMTLYPEVQAKAQAEIDTVIGNDRLPRVEDMENLPYIKAIMQEVFRWHPVVGLVPHAASQDDTYRGYFIPAGTAAIANVWAILHDERVYRDAGKFVPERFSEEGAPDSMEFAFGFGRRVCPGKLVAQAHLFVSIAATLATFNIAKGRDANGNIVEPVVEDSTHGINFPEPFEISLEPRSEAAAGLIRRSAEHSKSLPDNLEAFSLEE
ncbi:cytochrome P450 [Phanerochaete sordida]|uniref:Cytochrome P450 n=1 Tax=Phanerochaete sordida TaxID=48140 RepID=A0A9P3GEN0_9APHY|nr:cytochrome P450 [Phanerochaete sordida]